MPPEGDDLGSPADWLKRAKSNLARAGQPKVKDVLWEDLCFDAQQAAEKSLKAVLLFHGIEFRFVHDLAEFLTLLENNGVSLPEEIREAATLTDFAVETRYPGPYEPITEDEYKTAVKNAEAVVVWAENQISRRPRKNK